MQDTTDDVAAILHDLQSGVQHYFGDHTKYNSVYCKNTYTDTSNHYCIASIFEGENFSDFVVYPR